MCVCVINTNDQRHSNWGKKKKRLARQLVLFGAAVGDQSLPFRRDEQKHLIHILASS